MILPISVVQRGAAVAGQVRQPSVFTAHAQAESLPALKSADSLSLKVKRFIDLLGALLVLVVLSPVMVLVALLVGVTSRGPIFYKSLRIGRNSKPFYMYKFRTMVPNADRMRAALAEKHQMTGQLFKLANDSRITPVGGFLRKYSLDELPQLFNVLKGEMSLVGPRPYVPDESRLFRPPYTARFSVTPGMTGPWQVSGRSNLSFETLCRLEWEYIQDWSLWRDFGILLKTIPSVLLRQGAY